MTRASQHVLLVLVRGKFGEAMILSEVNSVSACRYVPTIQADDQCRPMLLQKEFQIKPTSSSVGWVDVQSEQLLFGVRDLISALNIIKTCGNLIANLIILLVFVLAAEHTIRRPFFGITLRWAIIVMSRTHSWHNKANHTLPTGLSITPDQTSFRFLSARFEACGFWMITVTMEIYVAVWNCVTFTLSIFAMQQQFLSNLFEIVNRLYPYGLIITEGGSEDD